MADLLSQDDLNALMEGSPFADTGPVEVKADLLSQDDLNALMGDLAFSGGGETGKPENEEALTLPNAEGNEMLDQDEIDNLLAMFGK
jgi:hypothetical protein